MYLTFALLTAAAYIVQLIEW